MFLKEKCYVKYFYNIFGSSYYKIKAALPVLFPVKRTFCNAVLLFRDQPGRRIEIIFFLKGKHLLKSLLIGVKTVVLAHMHADINTNTSSFEL